MSSRKVRWIAGAGVLWLATIAGLFAFVPTHSSSSTSTSNGPNGAVVVVEESSSSSTWESDPRGAATLLAAVIGTALVAFALISWGGRVGPIVVLATVAPASMLLMLSQALFFVPGMWLLCVAAILAVAERAEQRRLGRLPPPPGYRAPDALAHLDP